MKKIKIISILSVLVFLSVSCSDFLDKEPYTLTPETYFNNETELETFLTGVYSPLMQEFFYGNYYPLYNAGGDDLTFYQRSSPATSILCANANSSNTYLNTFWKILYEGINRANILLENVDNNTNISQATRDRIRGEALFLRAFYYFHLVEGWGDVPFRLKSTKSVYGLDAERTPKQIIYDQIIKDITTAIPYLYTSANIPYTGRVTQSAAKGILARIYLFRAGENNRDSEVGNPLTNTSDSILAYYRHAKQWALEVKESGLHGLVNPYKQVFIDMCQDKYNSTGIRESIWEVEEAGNRSTTEQAAGRIGNTLGFGSTNDYSTVPAYQNLTGMANPGYSYKFAYASLKLYEMYESEGDTARGDWSIANYEYTYDTNAPKAVTGRKYYYGKLPAGLTSVEGYPCTEEAASTSNKNKTRCAAKYRRELEVVTPKNKNYTPINFPILRYSDILLMIAEADNEINASPTELAYDCLDEVRNRAHITPLKGS
ncbi:MAG TPA: RagB/SusD family nutrient uptake outer membrane protein, partial [Paludibacteraceae bacterium]|nr:RagB/SusD family nutrient uptake outer membrane protein [Paludibacteraceae bacterium]